MTRDQMHRGGPVATSDRPAVFLGVANAVRVAVKVGHDEGWAVLLACPSRQLVRMQAERAARRDAEQMAWIARLRADNPGLFSTRRYVAHVLNGGINASGYRAGV